MSGGCAADGEAGPCSIIGISFISAHVGGGLQVHCTPTKAAVLSTIQSIAIALAKDKTWFKALLPGTIRI